MRVAKFHTSICPQAARIHELKSMEGWEGPFIVVMGKWILINKTKLIVTFKLLYLIFYNCFEANFESEWHYCFYDDYPLMNWPLWDNDFDVILSLVIDILSCVLLVKILWYGKVWPEHNSFLCQPRLYLWKTAHSNI